MDIRLPQLNFLNFKRSGITFLLLFFISPTFSQTVIFNADFENTSGDNSWTFQDLDGGTGDGDFRIANPTPYTQSSTTLMELEDTVGAAGTQTLHTGSGSNDIDGGPLTARSININIPNSAASASINLYWFFAHYTNGDSSDYLKIEIRDANNNSSLQTLLNENGAATDRDAQWSNLSVDISSHIGKLVYIYIETIDGGGGSKLEAGIDDIVVSITEAPPLDTDDDGVPDEIDIDDDNDGILDSEEVKHCYINSVEGGESLQWNNRGSATWNAPTTITVNNLEISATATNYGSGTGFALNDFTTDQTIGCNIAGTYHNDNIVGKPALSIRNTFSAGSGEGNLIITFSDYVLNPIINVDRLGGGNGAGTTTTSSVITLVTPGATFTELSSSGAHFITTATTITRESGTPYSSGSSAECVAYENRTQGTASGSVLINGTFKELTFKISMNPDSNISGTVNDRFEIMFSSITSGGIPDCDNDGIANQLDLDSDNDGIPDNVEAQSTLNYISPSGNIGNNGLFNIYENNDTSSATGLTPQNSDGENDGADYIDTDSDNEGGNDTIEAELTLTGGIGNNGLYASVENSDDYSDVNGTINTPSTLRDSDNDLLFSGDVDYRDNYTEGKPMITQTYHSSYGKCIEIKNIGTTNLRSGIFHVILYKDYTPENGSTNGISIPINRNVTPNGTVLICSNGITNNVTVNGTPIFNDSVTNFEGENDHIIVSYGNGSNSLSWEHRFDVASKIKNNSSYIRQDNFHQPNKIYTANEWVYYMDDDLSIDNNERHHDSPLLSQITNPNSYANEMLGTHSYGPVTYNANWGNGLPDRSREVVIDGDANFTTDIKLRARKLEIKPNRTVVVDGHGGLVTNEIILGNDSELRLIKGAQLVQTHMSASGISGNGKLLQDQKSSAVTNASGGAQYKSLYWSSPVTTDGNTFTISEVLKDGGSELLGNTTYQDIDFVEEWDGQNTTPIKISSRWLAKMMNDLSWKNYIDPSAEPFKPGEAWNMKSTNADNQNFTFVGKPNDGTYEITDVTAYQYFVIGNPYPSALDSDRFIKDNLDVLNGTMYFYDSTNDYSHYTANFAGGYATKTLTTSTEAPTYVEGKEIETTKPGRYLPVGQGFLMYSLENPVATGEDLKIVFNNAQRAYVKEGATSVQYARSQSENPENSSDFPVLRLGFEFLIEGEGTRKRSVAVAFNNKTYNYENGYDAYMFGIQPTDLGLKCADTGNSFMSITTIEDFNPDIEIPLLVYLDTDRTVTFRIDELENFPSTNIYLKDALTNQYYNVSNPDLSISFDLAQGSYYDRFSIVFKNESSLGIDDISKSSFNAFVDHSSNEIVVQQKNSELVSIVTLYNLLGQEVANWKNSSNATELRFKNNNINTAVYILKIQGENGLEFSKKIMIK